MNSRIRLRVDRSGSLTELSEYREDVHMVGLVVFPCSFSENRICRVGVPKKTDYATLWFVSGVPFPLNVPMYPTGTVFDIYNPKPEGVAASSSLDTIFSKEYFPFKKDAAFEFVTRVTAHLKLNSVASISAIRMLTFKKDGVERLEEEDDDDGTSSSDTEAEAVDGEDGELDEEEDDEDGDEDDEGQDDVDEDAEGEDDAHEEEEEEDDVEEGEDEDDENGEDMEEDDDEELEEDVEIDDVEEDDEEEDDDDV